MKKFKLVSKFKPCGDQPEAIKKITERIENNEPDTTLLGITGSGKTFTMANVIANVNKPTLILAPNKTLAAQLFSEFKELFPENAVEYFVSYYDYYQPEAYLPATDTYIEKDSSINELIDRMRHSATANLLTRNDVIVISSVSCIYGLGSPKTYKEMHLILDKGQEIDRNDVITQLITMQFERHDIDFHRGTFRVRGDVLEVFPADEDDKSIRVEFFGDEIDEISIVDPLTGEILSTPNQVQVFPNSHHVVDETKTKSAIKSIQAELLVQLTQLKELEKPLEAHRLEKRTYYDIEMIEEIGYCTGIENYSRHFDGRNPGDPPFTLFDYFQDDFMIFIDESHISVPQIGGMYRGDRSRKETLISHGFRLPSALDNRPLKFHEFEKKVKQRLYVSATPGKYELEEKKAEIVRQVIRPTGLLDPKIVIKPATGQVKALLELAQERVDKGDRVLVTTLTKRMAEDLTDFLNESGLRAKYLHSDIDTFERVEILRSLRLKEFDVLVGINLLREGLDLPEVSLVAILDADKEGFLRSARSLIQTCGRAARNVNGQVIMFADKITAAITSAINETEKRRKVQKEYNKKHNITPETIQKNIAESLSSTADMDYSDIPTKENKKNKQFHDIKNIPKHIEKLTKEMFKAASKLDFEAAAKLRDEIDDLKEFQLQSM